VGRACHGNHRFQQVNMALKYASKPVVAAPFGRTLGGGCEISLHATRVQGGCGTYMGWSRWAWD